MNHARPYVRRPSDGRPPSGECNVWHADANHEFWANVGTSIVYIYVSGDLDDGLDGEAVGLVTGFISFGIVDGFAIRRLVHRFVRFSRKSGNWSILSRVLLSGLSAVLVWLLDVRVRSGRLYCAV